jgi:hypothetical protein
MADGSGRKSGVRRNSHAERLIASMPAGDSVGLENHAENQPTKKVINYL